MNTSPPSNSPKVSLYAVGSGFDGSSGSEGFSGPEGSSGFGGSGVGFSHAAKANIIAAGINNKNNLFIKFFIFGVLNI
jgi:hypothetical protein